MFGCAIESPGLVLFLQDPTAVRLHCIRSWTLLFTDNFEHVNICYQLISVTGEKYSVKSSKG